MLRTATPIAAILTAGAVAACGGSPSHPSTASARAGTASLRTAALKYAACMRAHGVPSFPDPGSGSGGGLSIQGSATSGSGRTLTVNGVPVSDPAFQAAIQKCQKYLPKGPPLTPSQVNKLRQGAFAMARCMRAHGVTNFPDPKISTGPGGHGIGIRIQVGGQGAGIDPSSPAVQTAMRACQPLLRGARAAVGLGGGAGKAPGSISGG